MKQIRRRRHLRPRYTRSQVRHSIQQLQRTLHLLRVEAAMELNRPTPCAHRLRWLEQRVIECQDGITALEAC